MQRGMHVDRDVIVVGAGIAGLSVAIWARRLGLSVAVLEAGSKAGGELLALPMPLTDYPGVVETAGPALAAVLEQQARALGAELRLERRVIRVAAASRTCVTDGGAVTGRALVLATGLSPRRLGVPGEDDLFRHGLVRRPSAEPDWFKGKRVAVIGGGDRAAENALMLARGGAGEVILVHRRPELRARERFERPLRAEYNVSLLLNSQVRSFTIQGSQVTVDLVQAGADRQLPVDAVCTYIGNVPNTQLVQGQAALTHEGYLVTSAAGESSVPSMYGAGDICTPPESQSLIGSAGQAAAVAKRIALQLE
jgi:thioredoxin reductase (NADPH)